MGRKMIHTFCKGKPIKLVIEMDVRKDDATMQYVVDIPEQHFKADERMVNDGPAYGTNVTSYFIDDLGKGE